MFTPVTVSVPATSANLGPGFDSLGLALDLRDTVTVEPIEAGIEVRVEGEGAGEVPTDASHLIIVTMRATFAELGAKEPAGLRLICHNQIPQARGLGSSSAAVVAGILLAAALCPQASDRLDPLALAARLEGHPDNVAPCLLGGLTIAWTEPDGAHAVRLNPIAELRPTLFVPADRALTGPARAALPASVPHGDAAFNSARSALLVYALTAAPELLLPATEDRLHQGYRAPAQPETAALVAELRGRGVPAVVSGAGPSVLAFATVEGLELPPGWCSRSLSVASTGARILGDGHAGGDPVAAGLPS